MSAVPGWDLIPTRSIRGLCVWTGENRAAGYPVREGERGRECASRPGRLKCGDVRCVEDVVPADV